jgi:hypothetical protein
MDIYVAYNEDGEYSGYSMGIEGVFSTLEKAKSYFGEKATPDIRGERYWKEWAEKDGVWSRSMGRVGQSYRQAIERFTLDVPYIDREPEPVPAANHVTVDCTTGTVFQFLPIPEPEILAMGRFHIPNDGPHCAGPYSSEKG